MSNLIYKKTSSRRNFIRKSAITMAGISTYGLIACANNYRYEPFLRVIAYNVLKCTGYPPENVENKNQIPDLMAQELSKYSPDIINFSESPEESVVKRIAGKLNMGYVYLPSGGNWPGAILTRYEISDSANVPIIGGVRPKDLFTRHWGKATIKLPNQESLIIHSAHLYPHDNPVSAEIRKKEISEILKSMKKEIEEDKSIIVMGDLNLTPEMPEYQKWTNAGFTDSYIKAGKGDGLTVPVNVPNKRIDYVLVSGSIARKIVESRALFEGAFRTNLSETTSFALSDHLPQFAEFAIK